MKIQVEFGGAIYFVFKYIEHVVGSFYSAYQTDQTHISTTLMSEAAKLFSRLSTNRSVSEEDREMMRKWMEMKQDLVDETVNAQSHLQLERIGKRFVTKNI